MFIPGTEKCRSRENVGLPWPKEIGCSRHWLDMRLETLSPKREHVIRDKD